MTMTPIEEIISNAVSAAQHQFLRIRAIEIGWGEYYSLVAELGSRVEHVDHEVIKDVYCRGVLLSGPFGQVLVHPPFGDA